MALYVRPVSDADLSPVADLSHVNLNRWQARGNLTSQVTDGMLAAPELGSHRHHAGAAVASPAKLRIIVPPPSLRLSPPLRRRKPSLCSPLQGV
jgi:hypothetical protein